MNLSIQSTQHTSSKPNPSINLDSADTDEVLRTAYAAYRDDPVVMQLAKRLEQALEMLDAAAES